MEKDENLNNESTFNSNSNLNQNDNLHNTSKQSNIDFNSKTEIKNNDNKYTINNGILQEANKSGENFVKIALQSKDKVSPNSFLFRFKFSDTSKALGISTGEHISTELLVKTKNNPNGELVYHKYTPVSPINSLGFVDLLIKIYYPNEKFPEGGRLTQEIDKLEIGSTINIKGPLGKFNYLGNGKCLFHDSTTKIKIEKEYNKIGMLCAGTGIAPIFQVLQEAAINNDKTEFVLFYGNSTQKDILLKDEIIKLKEKLNLNVIFMINEKEDGWDGEVGKFNTEKIKLYMPPPSNNTLILYCGRKELNQEIYEKSLLLLGHSKDNIFKF